MPVENPMIGETWEMTDPASGQPAQAVIISLTDTSVRLMSRQQRTLTFPLRSFRLMWRFIQQAPEQPCAYANCTEQGYIQVNDLGRWVWVCHAHLPVHAKPLLPTDNNFDTWTSSGASSDRCPSCATPIGSEGYSHREVERHTLHRCGSCNSVWIQEVIPESDHIGLMGEERLQELASILEHEGFRSRALVGQDIWTSMLSLLGPIGETGVVGVETRMHTGDTKSIILLGDRPSGRRIGVRRLGGQPDRPAPAIPETGSFWQDCQSGKVMKVDQIRFATLTGQSGRQVRIEGTLAEGNAPIEVWLEDFVKTYVPHRVDAPDRLPPPCSVGESWEDSSGIVVEVTGVDADFVEVRLESGSPAVIPVATFRAKYKRVPPRKSALDRVLDDD